MTVSLTPSLTIRLRRYNGRPRGMIRTETSHLSITSLSILNLEVLVLRYRFR